MNKEEFKAKLVKSAQRKRLNYGDVTWGDQRLPPKIEILSTGIVEIDEPFVTVFYRINDFVTYCDVLPNPIYDPDYWTRMIRHSAEVIKSLEKFENRSIIKTLSAGDTKLRGFNNDIQILDEIDPE